MKKLKLQVEALTVESFEAGDQADWSGTVEGRALVPTPPYVGCIVLGTKPTNCPCTPAY